MNIMYSVDIFASLIRYIKYIVVLTRDVSFSEILKWWKKKFVLLRKIGNFGKINLLQIII